MNKVYTYSETYHKDLISAIQRFFETFGNGSTIFIVDVTNNQKQHVKAMLEIGDTLSLVNYVDGKSIKLTTRVLESIVRDILLNKLCCSSYADYILSTTIWAETETYAVSIELGVTQDIFGKRKALYRLRNVNGRIVLGDEEITSYSIMRSLATSLFILQYVGQVFNS